MNGNAMKASVLLVDVEVLVLVIVQMTSCRKRSQAIGTRVALRNDHHDGDNEGGFNQPKVTWS